MDHDMLVFLAIQKPYLPKENFQNFSFTIKFAFAIISVVR